MVDVDRAFFMYTLWIPCRYISYLRREGVLNKRISIPCGNGGLFLPEDMMRGADGAMTGFASP